MEHEKDLSEDLCTGGLIWAAREGRPRNDNQSVEGSTKRSDTNNNRCDSCVDSPKVQGKSTTKQ